jgi:hypothetical protein
MRRSLRQTSVDRALAALRPACFQRPPAPPPGPAQEWRIGSPSWEGTVGPDVLRWRPTRVDRTERFVRHDVLRMFVGGRFLSEDDKGVLFIDTASDKSLS